VTLAGGPNEITEAGMSDIHQPATFVMYTLYGVSLYIAGAIAKWNPVCVSRAVIPFLTIRYPALAGITRMPDIVLWPSRPADFVR
jgi:hypothetical protein